MDGFDFSGMIGLRIKGKEFIGSNIIEGKILAVKTRGQDELMVWIATTDSKIKPLLITHHGVDLMPETAISTH
jgi:hypothetical protein